VNDVNDLLRKCWFPFSRIARRHLFMRIRQISFMKHVLSPKKQFCDWTHDRACGRVIFSF
jgi:hypothetical protein